MITIDDTSWHEYDAASRQQAAIHIALIYFWLYEYGHLKIDDAEKVLIEARETSPSDLFEALSDGKLMSTYIDGNANRFLDSFYEETYLQAVQDKTIPNITISQQYSEPYNIENSWDNVDRAAPYFQKMYSLFQGDGK